MNAKYKNVVGNPFPKTAIALACMLFVSFEASAAPTVFDDGGEHAVVLEPLVGDHANSKHSPRFVSKNNGTIVTFDDKNVEGTISAVDGGKITFKNGSVEAEGVAVKVGQGADRPSVVELEDAVIRADRYAGNAVRLGATAGVGVEVNKNGNFTSTRGAINAQGEKAVGLTVKGKGQLNQTPITVTGKNSKGINVSDKGDLKMVGGVLRVDDDTVGGGSYAVNVTGKDAKVSLEGVEVELVGTALGANLKGGKFEMSDGRMTGVSPLSIITATEGAEIKLSNGAYVGNNNEGGKVSLSAGSGIKLDVDGSTINGDIEGVGVNARYVKPVFTLNNNSRWEGKSNIVGDMSIGRNSQWLLTGDSTVDSLRMDGGSVTFERGMNKVFDTLNVKGNLFGEGGHFQLDFAGAEHSKLKIGGSVSGQHTLTVFDRGDDGVGLADNQLKLVESGQGAIEGGGFALQGETVDAGAVQLKLEQGRNNWYLIPVGAELRENPIVNLAGLLPPVPGVPPVLPVPPAPNDVNGGGLNQQDAVPRLLRLATRLDGLDDQARELLFAGLEDLALPALGMPDLEVNVEAPVAVVNAEVPVVEVPDLVVRADAPVVEAPDLVVHADAPVVEAPGLVVHADAPVVDAPGLVARADAPVVEEFGLMAPTFTVVQTGERRLSKAANAAVGHQAASAALVTAEQNALVKRLGDLRMGDDNGGLWTRGFGKEQHIDTGSSRAFQQHVKGFEIGADTAVPLSEGKMYLGGVIGQGRGTQDFGKGTKGTIDTATLGGYASYIDQGGFYVDGVLKYTHMDNKIDITTNYGKQVDAKFKNHAVSASVEVGKQVGLGKGWFVEPQVEVQALRVNAGGYTASNGLSVEQDAMNSVQSRVGGVFGRNLKLESGLSLQPYAKASWVTEHAGESKVRINNTVSLDSKLPGSRAEVGAGAIIQVAQKHKIYVDGEYAKGSQIEQPWAVNAGYRYTW